MRHWVTGKTAVALLALGLAAWLVVPADAQKTKGKTRPAETKMLMKGIVYVNCAGLGGLLKDKGPTSDKDWEKVALHAIVLNEMSYVVMDDGRCPDKDWLGAAKTLRECSSKVAEAAKAKDAAAAQEAFKGVLGACAACHTAHKK